jgi:hypothetical protein
MEELNAAGSVAASLRLMRALGRPDVVYPSLEPFVHYDIMTSHVFSRWMQSISNRMMTRKREAKCNSSSPGCLDIIGFRSFKFHCKSCYTKVFYTEMATAR